MISNMCIYNGIDVACSCSAENDSVHGSEPISSSALNGHNAEIWIVVSRKMYARGLGPSQNQIFLTGKTSKAT